MLFILFFCGLLFMYFNLCMWNLEDFIRNQRVELKLVNPSSEEELDNILAFQWQNELVTCHQHLSAQMQKVLNEASGNENFINTGENDN